MCVRLSLGVVTAGRGQGQPRAGPRADLGSPPLWGLWNCLNHRAPSPPAPSVPSPRFAGIGFVAATEVGRRVTWSGRWFAFP